MSYAPCRPPPLSPALLFGLGLYAAPRALLDLALADAARCAARRYVGVFDRLAELGDARFLIDPIDLPIRFLLRLSAGTPALAVAREGELDPAPDAAVRGPLVDLVALLEGRLDGDALFFSRQLTVEGDTEKILILRNAIEGDEINVAELLLERVAPFDRLLRAALGPAAHALGFMESALSGLQQVLQHPLRQQIETRDAELERLAARVKQLEAVAQRRRAS